MIEVPTPHNEAKKGDIAKYVIMPGDPLRAKHIAEKYLTDVVCYNKVRNMFGFTGYYKGVKVSVQASGMGIPSMGIYSKELFEGYDVDVIIRVGTAGGLNDKLKLKDIVIAESVKSNSNYLNAIGMKENLELKADKKLLQEFKEYIKNKNKKAVFGKIFTNILFYSSLQDLEEIKNQGFLAVEMETLALYANAKLANKKALSILTVSDKPITKDALTSFQRQETVDEMVEIALDVILKNEVNKNV